MAKIGNEARLILKLAKKRAAQFLASRVIMKTLEAEAFEAGIRYGVGAYEGMLDSIVKELEIATG